MKKEKFDLLNFGSVAILSKEEMLKVKGGYGGGPVGPKICIRLNPTTYNWERVTTFTDGGVVVEITTYNQATQQC